MEHPYDELQRADVEDKADAEMRSAAVRLVLEKFGPERIDMIDGGEGRKLLEE